MLHKVTAFQAVLDRGL